MNIYVSSQEQEEQKISAVLTIAASDVDAEVAGTYKELSQRYNFHGFRKGHVPRAVINNIVGKDAIIDQATANLLEAAEPQLLEELNVVPIGRVQFGDGSERIQEGSDFSVSVTITMRPSCELSSYDAPSIELPSTEVSDEELTEQINLLLSYQSKAEDVEEDRAAEPGDLVSLNIENIQGASYLAGENRMANLDSKQLPPDLEAAIVGMKKGETKEVAWDRSHEHEGETISVHFAVKVTLNVIKQVVSPELNEDSAKKFGYDSVADFKEAVKEEVHADKARMLPNLKEDRAIDALGKLLVLDKVPDNYRNEIMNELANDFLARLQQQDMTLDAYLKARHVKTEDFIADLNAQAEERARQSLALDALARHLGFEASEEEVKKEFVNADAEHADELLEQWRDSGRLPAIRDSIKRSKALDWLLENVVVTEVSEDDQAAHKPAADEPAVSESEPAAEAAETGEEASESLGETEVKSAPEAASVPESGTDAADPEVSE